MGLFFGNKKNKNIKEVRELLKDLEESFRELRNLTNISKNNYGTPAPIIGIAKNNYNKLKRGVSKIDLLKLKLRHEKKLSKDLEKYLDELKELLILNIQLINKYFNLHFEELDKRTTNLPNITPEVKESAETFSKTIKKEEILPIFNKISNELDEIERAA